MYPTPPTHGFFPLQSPALVPTPCLATGASGAVPAASFLLLADNSSFMYLAQADGDLLLLV
jgi:hypothetical protein